MLKSGIMLPYSATVHWQTWHMHTSTRMHKWTCHSVDATLYLIIRQSISSWRKINFERVFLENWYNSEKDSWMENVLSLEACSEMYSLHFNTILIGVYFNDKYACQV